MSSNFTFYTPTEIIFGRETEKRVGELVQKWNGQKILIHYGSDRIKKSGLFGRITNTLEQSQIHWLELGGVVANPLLSLVYNGIDKCKSNGVNLILAIGGGSVIDSAKAIGYGVSNKGDVWDFYDNKRKPVACLPIGVVLTIPASGSEMSNSTVITREEGQLKRAYNDDLSRPKFAIMNPELTMTLPPYQTASGGVDIMMHTMERYFGHGNNLQITDSIAEALLKNVMRHTQNLLKNPTDYESRAEIMWCGSLAHNGLTECGSQGGDWSCHMLEHELSGLFNVAHGAGLAAIWGSWARYVMKDRTERFAQFALNVMNVTPEPTMEETAMKGIEAMENFYRSINMPTSLKELGVNPTNDQLDEMANKCEIATGGGIGAIKFLHRNDFSDIYRIAK